MCGGIDTSLECKFWLRGGSCWRGEDCMGLHLPEHKGIGALGGGSINAPIGRVQNRWRASIFRRWLLDSFGLDRLKMGSGVVDVAGGQGDLSFELLNLNGVVSTILDPRQGWNAKKASQLLMSGQYHCTEALLRHVTIPLEKCQHLGPQIPRHERMFLDNRLWTGDESSRTAACENLGKRAQRVVWRPRGLVAQENLESVDDSDAGSPASDAPPPISYPELKTLLGNASLIVGMHPDQAAGAIVDFSVVHRKPYALVPCCTFAKEFPRRRLAKGQPVCSYEDLMKWLLELDPDAIVDHLPFEGRNAVIYNFF